MLEVQVGHWQRRLGIPLDSLSLPTDHSRVDSAPLINEFPVPACPGSVRQALVDLAKLARLPLPIVYLAAYGTLLFKYSSQQDVCIGVPKRLLSDNTYQIASTDDFFPLLIRIEPTAPFTEFANSIYKRFQDDVVHCEGVTLEQIAQKVERFNGEPAELFRAVFSCVGMQAEPSTNSHVLLWDTEKRPSGVECLLVVNANTDDVSNQLYYRSDLFEQETIERFASHFVNLLESIVAQPDASVGELDLLSDAERSHLVEGVNRTQMLYPKDKTISQLFSEQARVSGGSVAVRGPDDRTLSYTQLEQDANRLAGYLGSRGVGPGKRVGVYLERSVEMMSTLLAVIKSGAAYVPLDPLFPADRLSYMADDAQLALIVTQSSLVEQVPIRGCEQVVLELLGDALQSQSAETIDHSTADSAAYVIYTSGSTGQPKGVQVGHRALVNFLSTMREKPGLSAEDKLLAVTTLSFDIAGLELYLPLLVGAEVTLASREEAMDPQMLLSRLATCQASVMQATPATWKMLIESGWTGSETLRVWCGGEAMSRDLAEGLLDRSGDVWNLYGPTETTIWSTLWCVERGTGAIPVGLPIGNTQVYVLDESGELVAPGVSGELYIGGDGVADGYLHREQLTAEKFVEDRYSTIAGSRMYRTGDRARWRSDGQLEVQGRLDDQVKLRGYRLEPGEIRAALVENEAVRDAVVMVREDGARGPELVAYLLAESGQELAIADLRSGLQGRMPEYMVPGNWVEMDEFPLTPNGKVDKKQLPVPQETEETINDVSLSESESQIASIWQEVLGLESVGIRKTFFELGGNSLLAIKLAAKIRAKHSLNVPVISLFQGATVADVAKLFTPAESSEDTVADADDTYLPVINPVVRTTGMPVSRMQKSLLFLAQAHPEAAPHNLTLSLKFSGSIDVDLLQQAVNLLIERHEPLRSVFDKSIVHPQQTILGSYQPGIKLFDLRNTLNPSGELFKRAQLFIDEPFETWVKPPHRVAVYRCSDDEYHLYWIFHHVISDGGSLALITKELGQVYTALLDNTTPQLPEQRIQYADFVHWEEQQLESNQWQHQLDYWKQKLQGEIPPLTIPADKPRPAIDSVKGDHVRIHLPPQLMEQVAALSSECGVSLFTMMLTVYKAFLNRVCDQSDVIVCTPVMLRNQPDLENILGILINTVAVRTQIDRSCSGRKLLELVQANWMEAYDNKDIPFQDVIEAIQPADEHTVTPIFQTLFIFAPENSAQDLSDSLNYTPTLARPDASETDLMVEFLDTAEGLTGVFAYRSDLFEQETIERFASHFVNLLESIVAQPDASVGELDLLSDAERSHLVEGVNRTQMLYPKDKTISQLFSEQARVSGGSVAVRGPDDRTLSYTQLEQDANRLAGYLGSRGVGPGKRVGVYLERSVEMMSTLLAVIKSGAAYVPLDPLFPADRLSYMADDAQLALIVTQSSLVEQVPIRGCEQVVLELLGDALQSQSAETIDHSTADSAAYVIYTSGSTGQPKGVQVGHRALVNFLSTMREKPGLSAEDKLLAVTTLSFDIAGLELYLPLLVGAEVTLASREEAMDPQMLLSRLATCQASVMQATPATWKMLIESGWTGSETLRVWCGGEAMSRDLAEGLLDRSGDVWNLYGPTETTIWSTLWCVERGTGAIPVGLPIGNTQVYVLDESGELVAPGVSGELYIGGDGVADGYLHREQLTAEKFVEDRYSTIAGSRMYRTGDRARWRSDGQLEVQGRLDDQVKLRGYRLEPGEIRAALVENEAVRDAVVMVREDGARGPELVAYLLAESGQELAIADLRSGLQGRMPEYMVPGNWVEMDEFPLTPNGKVDKKQLPAITGNSSRGGVYAAPRTQTEKRLATIWQELLGVSKVDRQDHFFAIGGHSLKAVQLISRIRSAFDIDLPLSTLFQQATLIQISQLIDELGGRQDTTGAVSLVPSIPLVDRSEVVPLSYAQERLWFLDQLEGSSELFNIPLAIRIRGELNSEAFEKALSVIVDRHEVLRTQVASDKHGMPKQVITPAQLHLEKRQILGTRTQCETAIAEYISKETSSIFKLSDELKIKASLVRITVDNEVADNEYILFVNMHHIASDAWSMSLFTNELSIIYSALVSEHDYTEMVPSLPIQYCDYANWQREWLSDERLKSQVDYWKNQLAGAPSLLEIPTDFERPVQQSYAGSTKSFVFSNDLLDKVHAVSKHNDATLFMTLLAAFNVLMSRYSASEDIVVGSPMANRSAEEIEPLIGFFVNTLVLRTEVSGEYSFNDLIAQVRRTALEAFENQDVPFERLVEELQPARDTGYSPLFQVLFQLQNAPLSEIEMAGVQAELIPLEEQSAKYDLTLGMYETDEGLSGWINYNSSLFELSTIKLMVERFKLLLDALISTPEIPVKQLSIPGLAEHTNGEGSSGRPAHARPTLTIVENSRESKPAIGYNPRLVKPRTGSEIKIAAIWKEILEIDEVGVTNSFFELGGYSLLAVRLVTKIRDQLDLDISLLQLFQGATVASMAVLLDNKVVIKDELDVADSATCRLINASTGDKPFFMLGSNPRYSMATVDLDPMIAVYQLDAYALHVTERESGKPVPKTIEKIAASMLSHVKAIQPTGPYRFGGGCEGALIALEMALMLQREGEEVEQLLTWHTTPPGPIMKEEFGGSTARRFWWQLQSVLSKGKSMRLGIRGYGELIRHEVIEYSLLAAMFKYRPAQKFRGDMELVVLEPDDRKVTSADDVYYRNHIAAWQSTIEGQLNVCLLTGTHDTWLRDHVDVFAGYLASRLCKTSVVRNVSAVNPGSSDSGIPDELGPESDIAI